MSGDPLPSIPVFALVDELCDAFGWPRSRPPRILSGHAASMVSSVVCVAAERLIVEVSDPTAAIVLCDTPTAEIVGRGRRATDRIRGTGAGDDAEWTPSDWNTPDVVVIDAHELFAGGRGGIDDLVAIQAARANSPGVNGEPVTPTVIAPVPADLIKCIGFVPESHIEAVRIALHEAGAGTIGNYDRCSWSTSGTGRFRGLDGSDPAIGTAGSDESVAEIRIEMVAPTHLRDEFVRAFCAAHPYEEPAFDVYSVTTPAHAGYGRLISTTPGHVAISTAGIEHVRRPLYRAWAHQPLHIHASVTAADHPWITAMGWTVEPLDRQEVLRLHLPDVARHIDTTVSIPVTTLSSGLTFPDKDVSPPAPRKSQARSDDQLQIAVEGTEASTGDETAAGHDDHDIAMVPRRLWFDGGSRGNPGPAAYAFVLEDEDGIEIERFGEAIGDETNNVAEYSGLVNGVRRALDLGAADLRIFSDSELVVKQIQGLYKVKHPSMKPLYEQAKQLLSGLNSFTIEHVRREQNSVADSLVNETLDAAAL